MSDKKTQVKINTLNHKFTKTNLVTIFSGKKNYDILKCDNCGLEVKTGILGSVYINPSKMTCKKPSHFTKVIVTLCNALGSKFSNLTPNSIHDIVEPPVGYKNFERGVWVMGVGEKVLLLNDEFKPL
jgi:hypothetical protein